VIKASASELHNNKAERTTASPIYVVLKETLITTTGIMRTSFDLKQSNALAVAYGKVYRNGVAVGTERTTSLTTYQTFTEDILFAAGDLYQIYVKVSGGWSAFVRNQKVLGTIVTTFEDTAGF
jgi:hypothetical protein